MKKQIPNYPLVKFNFDDTPKEYHKGYAKFKGKTFIMIGEIEQMKGHCIIIDIKTGKIYSGYHTDNFIKLTEDEV